MSRAGQLHDAAGGHAETAADRLPAILTRIRNEARLFHGYDEERSRTASEWARQAETLRKAAPGVAVEDDGETIRLGALSPGCAACKAGKWDCVFCTLSCNLDCEFCLTPRALSGTPRLSSLGHGMAELCQQYARVGVTGVSFSGGEPFLDPDIVLNGLSTLRREFPELYIWAYTNGLLLSRPLLARLADAGLNELRFNMAATGYNHPHVSGMLYEAAACIPSVAVETPAIPGHEAHLLGSLHAWADGGVKHLNLHELIYEPGSRSEGMAGARADCRMPDGHQCSFNPGSSDLAAKVFAKVAADRIPIAVNYCTLRNKARQARGRRRLLAPLVIDPHEQLREDGLAESVCFFGDASVEFAHPSALGTRPRRQSGRRAALLRRLLPLSLFGEGQWVHFELVSENAGGARL